MYASKSLKFQQPDHVAFSACVPHTNFVDTNFVGVRHTGRSGTGDAVLATGDGGNDILSCAMAMICLLVPT
jgi:hypothetical protein